MSHPCITYGGKPKIKHRSLAEAKVHAKRLNKTRIYRSEAYHCPSCRFYHAGRIPRTAEMRRVQKHLDAVNERLVGHVIKALKETINGQ